MRRDTPTFNETLKQLKAGSAKFWILLVGVNQYQKPWNSLNYAVADCQGLKKALEKATEPFKSTEFLVHHDGANLPPTLDAVRGSLQKIASKAYSLDVILFYFAGHGKIERKSQETFLCLADTQPEDLSNTGLALNEVLQKFHNCLACKQLFLLDACHSGGITSVLGRQKEPDPIIGITRALHKQADQRMGFCAILSCNKNQKSWEYPELKHGVFTYYLIKGFQGEAADRIGIINTFNLYEFVQAQIRLWVTDKHKEIDQTPLLVTITTEPIVIGLVPPDYSSYSYGEKFIEYYKAVEQAIQLQTSLKNSIEDIRTIEDIIDQKSRQVLQKFSHQLALTERKVKEAEQDITQNHKDLLVLYKQEIIKVLKQEYPLTQDALQQLDKSQEIRGINSKIATAIRRQLTQEYEQKSQRYREDFRMLLYQKMLTPDQANQELQELQQELDLSTARVESLEAEVIPDYQRDKQWCQQKLEEAIRQIYPINSENIDELLRQQKRDLKQERGLNYQTIESISSVVVTRYKQHLQYYRETYTIIKRGCPAQDELTLLDNLSRFIADETACIIRAEVDDEIDDNIIKSKVDYERIFTQVIQQQHPNLPSEEFLENLRKASRLSQESIDSIEAKILERNGRTFSIPSVEKENEYSPPYSTKLRAWIDSDYQDKSQLLQGQELTEAQNWIDNYGWDRLNKKEQEFIKKSIVRNVL